MLSGLWVGPRTSLLRASVAAVIGPAAVTLLALPERQVPVTTAALLYVLAVALAAAVGGAPAGVGASLLSFLSLNFFFTPPLHTFQVGQSQDLAALLAFLVVAVVTGLLLSWAVREKEHAERREQQTRLLNRLTARLLAGLPLEEVVDGFAQSLVDLLGLAACEITTASTRPVRVGDVAGTGAGSPFIVDLGVRGGHIGHIRALPPVSRGELDADEQDVIRNFAGQLALALESRRLSDEIRQAQFDAETSRLRAALFSGVTHDLKTPLSAITASVTSLLDGSGFSQQERFDHLDTIKQEAEHLNRVVTNLMDLSRLRAGALVPTKVPGAIDELIEAVIARLQHLLNGRQVHLNLREDLPEIAMDIVQIDQVLTNLIENAVKFSPAGSPIFVSAVGSREVIRVTVADRGRGITPSEREQIFEPFVSGDGDGTGTGLGLAIARAAVIAHEGRMWAGENPGGGAAVTFELPTNTGRA